MSTTYRDVTAEIGGVTYAATSLTVSNTLPNSTFSRLGQRGLFRADAPIEASMSLSSYLTHSDEFSTFIADKKKTEATAVGAGDAYLTSLSVRGDPAGLVTLDIELDGGTLAMPSASAPIDTAFTPAVGVLTEIVGLGGTNFTFDYSLTKSYGKKLFIGEDYSYYLEGGEERLTIESESASPGMSSPCPSTHDASLSFYSCDGFIGSLALTSGRLVEYSSEVSEGGTVKNTLSIANTF